jgi:hypothetical protein
MATSLLERTGPPVFGRVAENPASGRSSARFDSTPEDQLNVSNASVVEVSRRIWQAHETDIRTSGDLLFTWQYDVRWAAHTLRRDGVLKPADESPRGVWELV